MALHDLPMDNQWLPFTPNRHFKKDPRVFVAADGMHFTTHDGRKVIDGVSSLWCVGAGHNRKPINEAIKQQLDTLDYATAFQASNDQAFKAAKMIADMAPGDLNKVLFCNSGSEAADTALKVALAYHRARGEGHRHVFIGREKGYHGVNFGGMSVGGLPANRKVYGAQLLPRVDHMRFIHDPVNHAYIHHEEPVWTEDPLVELETRILALHDPSNVAAIIVEPVAGSAGWYIPPKGYLQRLRQICDKHGILLIFDEVITGFGRLGTGFAAEKFGVIPDLMTVAKGISNATVPMGGFRATIPDGEAQALTDRYRFLLLPIPAGGDSAALVRGLACAQDRKAAEAAWLRHSFTAATAGVTLSGCGRRGRGGPSPGRARGGDRGTSRPGCCAGSRRCRRRSTVPAR